MYYIYILQCKDNTLYTGYTVNLEKRLKAHNSGTGAKYTRGRIPVSMVYSEEFVDKIEAQNRERAIKKLSRTKKLYLIASLIK